MNSSLSQNYFGSQPPSDTVCTLVRRIFVSLQSTKLSVHQYFCVFQWFPLHPCPVAQQPHAIHHVSQLEWGYEVDVWASPPPLNLYPESWKFFSATYRKILLIPTVICYISLSGKCECCSWWDFCRPPTVPLFIGRDYNLHFSHFKCLLEKLAAQVLK